MIGPLLVLRWGWRRVVAARERWLDARVRVRIAALLQRVWGGV